MLWTIRIVVLWSLLGFALPPHTPLERARYPIRVLVITGGNFHDFTGNTALLLAGAEQFAPLHWTRMNLSAGAPTGDVGPAELDDPALATKCEVILAYTQGELGLTASQKTGMLAFVANGGGFVGLHCAADSHSGWAAYVAMLGGAFQTHPPL
jgi:hypothetical protein